MIDEGVFKNEWAVICERFGRDTSRLLTRRYYEYLSPRLTTEEFQAAAQHVLATREFFPRPADFVEAVRSEDALWSDQLDLLRKVMKGRVGAMDDMIPAARKAVRTMGGTKYLRMTKLDEVQFVEKRFREHYEAALAKQRARERDRLPPFSDKGKRLMQDAMDGKLDYLTRGETA